MYKRITKVLVYMLLPVCTLFSADTVYVLKQGETMYALSRKYNVPLSTLLEYNSIETPAKVTAGQTIYIPETYIVQKGDTFYSIARKFSVSVSQLQAVNKVGHSNVLPVGKILMIPDKHEPKLSQQNFEKRESASTPTGFMDWIDPRLYVKKTLDKDIVWPVPAKDISYLAGKLYGVVIDSQASAAVKAIASGKLIFQCPHRGYGHVVFIQTETKYLYVYAGLSSIIRQIDDEIPAGEAIGTLASDTLSGTPRLYFMVYHNNEPIDPAKAPRNL
ncbi:MAG: LysM peptidoglycan-binding domain-containing protein [Treponema sp.]